MQKFLIQYKKIITFFTTTHFQLFVFFILFILKLNAQPCPINIDFESGNFNGWTCYSGSVAQVAGKNVITLNSSGGPLFSQHQLFDAAISTGETDYYGGFPVICPNGSGYSVKLGNNSGGHQAEGISYEFTIPANRNTFSLIYHYAVVFQDPRHLDFQQPRLELEITNLTDNELIECSSFTFFPLGSPLPGFFQSPNSADSTTVWCKDWSAVTINLNGKAGKTIQLFFKTADCVFTRHFGYAYIDVNTECSSEFTGATYCPDDTAVNVIAPYGYSNYNWFNNTFSQHLGSQQQIRFSPPPAVGTTIAVELTPYNGYGCTDTLYARLIDTLTLKAFAGVDAISCNQELVKLGENPKPGVVYSWTPATGLTNAFIANPRAGPANNTTYELTVRNAGGGCLSRDTVIITAPYIDSSLLVNGNTAYCITSNDSTVFYVQPADSIQWFRNNLAIRSANQTRFKASLSGTYHAVLYNFLGCSLSTRPQQVLIEIPKPGITYPVQYSVVNNPLQLAARDFGISTIWKPSAHLDDPSNTNPVFKVTNEIDQLYTIEIKTVAGCLTTDTQFVKSIKEVKIYVPNAFTPNNNGLNDLLRPLLLGVKEIKFFRIYNRWGQLVYDMQSADRGWDGTFKGMLQPSGTFVWLVQGLGLDNKIYTQKGITTLIR